MKLEIFIYLLLVISVIAEDEDVHDESAEIKSAEVDVESELIQIDSQKYFDKFTLRYEKEYENDTVLAEGMVNFDGNWNAIKAHNELAQMDLVPFTMKPQPFMDEPLEKVRDRLCGLIVPEVVTPRNLPFGPPPPKTFYPPAPKSKNWCYLHDEVRGKFFISYFANHINQMSRNRSAGLRCMLGKEIIENNFYLTHRLTPSVLRHGGCR